MENETHIKKNSALPASILASALILAGAWLYTAESRTTSVKQEASHAANSNEVPVSALEWEVLPLKGVVLPVRLGNLGGKLASVGALDREKFLSLYNGTDREIARRLIDEETDTPVLLARENAGILLNLFWALGLASKNPILDFGEMTEPAYGGAGNFASTAGWTIAQGNPMEHYSRHMFFELSPEQQALVDKVSRGIYRPCCGNSTHFPDCNHGMAMLGLLELMASQGVGEAEMWKTALAVNSYWFPDTYLTIAAYMKNKGVDWKNVSPQEMLGADYSSAQGFARIASEVSTREKAGGGSCGVNSEQQVVSQRPQNGCGV